MEPLEPWSHLGCFSSERRNRVPATARRKSASEACRCGARIVRLVMRRTRQALRSIDSKNRSTKAGSKRSRSSGKANAELVSSQRIGLYGHTAWEVCPEELVSALGTAPPADFDCSEAQALEQPVLRVASRSAHPRRAARPGRDRRRERRLRVRGANVPVPGMKTDFTFLIGVTNALAFEAIVFMALLLVWYGVSSLSAEVPL